MSDIAVEKFALELCEELPQNQYAIITSHTGSGGFRWLDLEELKYIVDRLRPDITLSYNFAYPPQDPAGRSHGLQKN